MNQNLFTLKNFGNAKSVPDIIAVTSGKGGVGKTMVSVNLSIILKKLKKNVLLLDADLHLGNVDLMLGLRPQYTVADVLLGEKQLHEVIITGPEKLAILPAASAVNELLAIEDDALKMLGEAFSKFQHEYDTIVVDTGAGISASVMSFVLGADKVVVVVTPDPAAIADAYGMIKVIKNNKLDIPVLLVTNMVANYAEGESLFKKMNLMVQRFLGSSIIFGGAIYRDNNIAAAVRNQRPIVLDYPTSVPVNALRVITRNLLQLPRTGAFERTGLFDRIMTTRDIIVGQV
jgi:flagellar biosynthesis protein FlhG